ETPELIHKAEIDPLVGPQPYQARELGFKLGLTPVQMKQFVKMCMGLAKMFNDFDFALLEINPL
ncbi:MAG: succinate--CoA ligase subunit beta, partial [Colwellia sp.]